MEYHTISCNTMQFDNLTGQFDEAFWRTPELPRNLNLEEPRRYLKNQKKMGNGDSFLAFWWMQWQSFLLTLSTKVTRKQDLVPSLGGGTYLEELDGFDW